LNIELYSQFKKEKEYSQIKNGTGQKKSEYHSVKIKVETIQIIKIKT